MTGGLRRGLGWRVLRPFSHCFLGNGILGTVLVFYNSGLAIGVFFFVLLFVLDFLSAGLPLRNLIVYDQINHHLHEVVVFTQE